MRLTIPPQLQSPDYRFIEIPAGEKGPKIKGWQNESCKQFNSFSLFNHIKNGGNYGVVLGFGDLIVLDIDDLEPVSFIIRLLPKTFTIRTGGGGLHMYYRCPDMPGCIRLRGADGRMGGVGDIKAKGGQVVGPGSQHPSGSFYVVENDVPIADITAAQMEKVMGRFYVKRLNHSPRSDNFVPSNHERDDFDIMDLLTTEDLIRYGGQYRGPHPIHGSENGQNFSVSPRDNVWYCFRHGTGGGPWHLLAMMEGLLDCEQCGPGSIDREMFIKLLIIAEEKGLIEPWYKRKV